MFPVLCVLDQPLLCDASKVYFTTPRQIRSGRSTFSAFWSSVWDEKESKRARSCGVAGVSYVWTNAKCNFVFSKLGSSVQTESTEAFQRTDQSWKKTRKLRVKCAANEAARDRYETYPSIQSLSERWVRTSGWNKLMSPNHRRQVIKPWGNLGAVAPEILQCLEKIV